MHFNVRFYIDNCTEDNEAALLQDLLLSYEFKRKIFQPTRKNNCLDNILINFNAQREFAKVMRTVFSDHNAQILHINISDSKNEYIYKKLRPLTLSCFNLMHKILDNHRWD